MRIRTDLMTASRVDVALILLPMIGAEEAERMLIDSSVPRAVIERVLTRPVERRPIRETARAEPAPYFGQA